MWDLKLCLKTKICNLSSRDFTSLTFLVIQVPPFLVHKIFTQIFSFINVQLFNRYLFVCVCVCVCVCECVCTFITWLYNKVKGYGQFPWKLCGICLTHLCSLLLRRECCSFSNGEYVKAGLAELEQWCCKATEEVSSRQSFVTIIPCHFLLGPSPKFFLWTVCRFSMGWTEAHKTGCRIPG